MEGFGTLVMDLASHSGIGLNFVLNRNALFCSALQVSELWKTHMRHQDPAETLNKDIISHFVLRLVYCRT